MDSLVTQVINPSKAGEINDLLRTIMQLIPRYPIVDTGPLFDFLLWRFSEFIKIRTLSTELKYLPTNAHKKSLNWYFTVAKPITTCSEVIAEIHRHAEQKLRYPSLGSFWKFAQNELTELGLNEKLVELIQMDGDTLSSFGPTDTALLDLSGNLKQPVFTEDTKLAGQCRKRQLTVLGIDDVLSLWQQYEVK